MNAVKKYAVELVLLVLFLAINIVVVFYFDGKIETEQKFAELKREQQIAVNKDKAESQTVTGDETKSSVNKGAEVSAENTAKASNVSSSAEIKSDVIEDNNSVSDVENDVEDEGLQDRIDRDSVKDSYHLKDYNSKSENKIYTYGPDNVFDNDPETAWVTKPKTKGKNNWIKFYFKTEEKIKSIYIRSGLWVQEWYQNTGDEKKELHNRLKENSRPKEIRITTNNGYSEEFTLDDYASYVKLSNWQDYDEDLKLSLGNGIKAEWIKIEILSIYEGSRESFKEDVCISDVWVK